MSDLERYRPLARAIARRYYLPGAEPEDLEQEAMIGLLKAQRDYRPELGDFLPFAAVCITRQVITAVKTATRLKHGPLNDAVRERSALADSELSILGRTPAPGADPARIVETREHLAALLEVIAFDLTPLERRALIGVANGQTHLEIADEVGGNIAWPDGRPRAKRVENALGRARRKLELVPPTELQAVAA